MKFLTFCLPIFTAVASEHTGHNHAELKPNGPFYAIVTHLNKAGDKKWNDMELAINFKENSFDLQWYYGAKVQGVNIPKQTFRCKDVPFSFEEDKLRIVINPDSNPCLNRINSNFPKGFGLSDPMFVPIDHDTGDLTFGIAGGLVGLQLYAVDSIPAKIPSGENGLAPAVVPGRRKEAGDVTPARPDDNDNGPVNTEDYTPKPPMGASAEVTTKSSTAKVGSVIISTAAIIFAGLFL
jgi:hypothetical protein